MTECEKLEKYQINFSKLSDGKQDYVLAIQQALLFAQNSTEAPPPQNGTPDEKQSA